MTISRAWRQALYVVAGTTLLRLIIGALVPLFPDETYYWDWSRSLQAGYFDHPPMIALLVRAGTTIFGDTPFGVRFFPILAGGATAYAIALTARALADDEAGRLAAIVFSVLPIAAAGFVLATPDAPMLCALAWTLYAVVRALLVGVDGADQPSRADSGRRTGAAVGVPVSATVWWCLAGLCIGLAMASKFTSVLVPLAIAIACLLHGRLQNRLGERGPYLAVVIASLVLLPVLIWNWQNDWVSFVFQLGHGLGEPKGGALGALNREAQLVGGQLGLVSPILFYFVVRSIKRGFDQTPDGIRVALAVIPVVCFAFFFYSATRRNVEANWPAIAWLPAVILLAIDAPYSARAAKWLNGGVALAAVLSGIIYIHTLVPILPLRADRDQVAKAFGWDQLANVVDHRKEYVESRAALGVAKVWVAAERYQDASELAFHLNGHPHVLSLNLMGRANQYDLWPSFTDVAKSGDGLMLVLADQIGEPAEIRRLSCCFRIDQGQSVALMRGEDFVQRKRLWLLRSWNGEWPQRIQPFPWTN